jgi:hypothetical protein
MIQSFAKLATTTLGDLGCVISMAPKKILSEVRLFDLILADGLPLESFHGIYCFYANDSVTCLYVGKVERPQFIERLPSHLSLSKGSWFNQFMRGVKEGCPTFEQAAQIAKECTLLIIPMPQQFVRLAELILIERLNPGLNKKKHKSGYATAKYDLSVFGDILQGEQ